MMIFPANNAHNPMIVPGQVQAAQQFLCYANMLRNPEPMFEGMAAAEPRELSRHEQEAYDAALDVMIKYFQRPVSEMMAEPAPWPHDDGGDDPKARRKAPV